MSDVNATIDAYLEGLTQADAARRADLIRTAWAEDGRFVDPLFDVQGHAALDELAQGVIAQYPGHTFRRTSGVDRGPGCPAIRRASVGRSGPHGRARRGRNKSHDYCESQSRSLPDPGLGDPGGHARRHGPTGGTAGRAGRVG